MSLLKLQTWGNFVRDTIFPNNIISNKIFKSHLQQNHVCKEKEKANIETEYRLPCILVHICMAGEDLFFEVETYKLTDN